ncbi:acetyltransferase, GNAT family [Fructobacillus fructosus]|uniref:GNAT family N-acetyltransferase n=1 Tax=Fructobacillus fructosus TaxID=1631 RepID=UPI000496B4EF|nr:GNAT family N-acetyltransferase [Fructobacillus fructosus]GAP00959.1 acetyltransferase, GNAT family [Fructobacillus fructosus]
MPAVYMRRAKARDIDEIVEILQTAKNFLKEQGLDQWQGDYPNAGTIQMDLDKHQAFVLMVGNQVAGYAAAFEGEDALYTALEDGSWLKDGHDYASLHRVAMSDKFRGQRLTPRFITALISYFYAQGARDFRIDTHPGNLPMQKVIANNGFEQRGTVHMQEAPHISTARWAYQLLIEDDE